MGNVRPDYIKRIVMKFVESYPDTFSENFEQNKEKLKEMAIIPSKPLRNKVAGYMATYVKKIKAREIR